MPTYTPMKNSCIQCKQSKILVLLLIIPIMALSSCDSCNCTEDSLDEIKAFKPDDKYFKSSLVALHFMMETSPVAEVDTLFQQLIQLYELPVKAEGAKDGSYIGSTPYDAFDYRHEVKIKILNGKIVEVDYNEVKKDGRGKQEDEEYCEEMSVSGTTPAIAYPLMEEMLLTTQNMMEVDAVSGASYSLQRFRLAMTIALMKAII
jgi:major membrane immunogen (membrane-anchored lipoprotein)